MDRNSLAEHCYIAASSEELGHEVVAAEHCCIELAAKLEKDPHLPEVLEPQGPLVNSVAEKVERALEDF